MSQRRREYSLEATLAGEGWRTVNIGHNRKLSWAGLEVMYFAVLESCKILRTMS